MTNRTKQFIYDFAQHHYEPSFVAIDHDAIKSLQLAQSGLSLLPSFLPERMRATPATGIAFLIALNAINYMFWDIKEVDGARTLARYSYDGKEGAMGMRAAFDKFWEAHVNNLGGYPAVLDVADIKLYFGDIPDPAGRAVLLDDVLQGTGLFSFAGGLLSKIKNSGKVDADDAANLAQSFSIAYSDPFFKRAQLAIAMVAGFLSECGMSVDTSGLTLFADYQVPRSLRALKLLSYSEALLAKIDSLTLIEEGSKEENAICAATILAGRAMADHFGASEAVLDNFLWQYRKQAGAIPFHLTHTRRY